MAHLLVIDDDEQFREMLIQDILGVTVSLIGAKTAIVKPDAGIDLRQAIKQALD